MIYIDGHGHLKNITNLPYQACILNNPTSIADARYELDKRCKILSTATPKDLRFMNNAYIDYGVSSVDSIEDLYKTELNNLICKSYALGWKEIQDTTPYNLRRKYIIKWQD